MHTTVAGYTYGTEEVARSPLSMEDLGLLKQWFFCALICQLHHGKTVGD
jgi:hypothetical protein